MVQPRLHFTSPPALQPGRVNPDIQVKWVTFTLGHAGSLGQAQKSGFIILSNIAVTNNTSDCLLKSIDLISVIYSSEMFSQAVNLRLC